MSIQFFTTSWLCRKLHPISTNGERRKKSACTITFLTLSMSTRTSWVYLKMVITFSLIFTDRKRGSCFQKHLLLIPFTWGGGGGGMSLPIWLSGPKFFSGELPPVWGSAARGSINTLSILTSSGGHLSGRGKHPNGMHSCSISVCSYFKADECNCVDPKVVTVAV